MSRGRRTPVAAARRRLVLGSLVVLALLAVTYGVFTRELPGTGHWSVQAVFSDSGQLVAGSPVRIAGVNVGTVSAVGRGPGTTALLTLRVKALGRPLHTDAVATIRPRLFLEGSYYVDLRQGSPSAPVLGAGATIPLGQTAVPVSFSTVLSTLTRPVRDSLTDIVGQSSVALSGGGAEGFGEALRELGPAGRSGAIATQAALGEQPDDVRRLITGAGRATAALAADAPALAAGITAANRVTGVLAAEQGALTAALRGVDLTVRAVVPAADALVPALPVLTRFAHDLDPALRVAPAPLRHVAAVLTQVRGLVRPSELPLATRRLVPAARALTALTPELRRLFPVVRRVAACTGRQGVSLLDTRLQDGPLTTGQPIWLELAHSAVSGASISQGFDAAGHAVRFSTSVQPGVLALGSVPGVGMALTNLNSGAQQIRPAWEGTTPPAYHPEVPCGTQPLGDLQAPAVPAATMRKALLGVAPGTTGADVLSVIRRATRRLADRSGR